MNQMIDDLIQTEDDSKSKGKALELEKLLVAYVADDEAHMDRFDDDIEMRLCYDDDEAKHSMRQSWSNPDEIIPTMLITW